MEREESAETRGDREVVGVLVDSVKRSGCALSEDGRRERWEERDEALRARIVLEYSMGQAPAVRVPTLFSTTSPHSRLWFAEDVDVAIFTTLMLTYLTFSRCIMPMQSLRYTVSDLLRSLSGPNVLRKSQPPISANTLIQNRRRRP